VGDFLYGGLLPRGRWRRRREDAPSVQREPRASADRACVRARAITVAVCLSGRNRGCSVAASSSSSSGSPPLFGRAARLEFVGERPLHTRAITSPGDVSTRRAPSPHLTSVSRCEFESRDSCDSTRCNAGKSGCACDVRWRCIRSRDERQRSHPPRRVPLGLPHARRLRHASTPAHFQGEWTLRCVFSLQLAVT
jgi:hypothetical protein